MSVKTFVMARYVVYPLALYMFYRLYREYVDKTYDELTYADWAWIILLGRTVGYTAFKRAV